MPKLDSRLPVLQRALSVRADSLNDEKRTVDLIFATEREAAMWHWDIGDYDEILTCSEPAADLTRIRNGGALLSEHDRSKQIGVIESAKFENGQGIATARFSKSALGEQEFQDVKAGIRRNFSVSYRVKELTAEKVSDEDGNVYRATAWEPLEISLVSVPADINCQAIREAREHKENTKPVVIRIPSTLKLSDTMKRSYKNFFFAPPTDPPGASSAPVIDEAEINRRATKIAEDRDKATLENRTQLREAAKAFDECGMTPPVTLLDDALDKSLPVDQFRSAVVEHFRKAQKSKVVTRSGADNSGSQNAPMCRSIGEQITIADAYRAARGTSKRAMEVKIPDVTNFRATLLTTTITGFTPTIQPSGIIQLGLQQATVSDLMPQIPTNLASYPYWQEDTFTPSATSVAQEGLKPDAVWDLSQATAPVVKIAVIGRVSDEAFDDVPSLEGYVNTRLRYSVEIEEDRQLLVGAGGADMTGIIATSGVQTQALGGDTKPDAVRKAVTKIQINSFFQPDGIVFHPNDWEQICLLKDTAGQYLAGGPFYGPYGNGDYVQFQRIWGLRVVVTTQCTEGTAVVGAWMSGASVLRRKGLTIDTTNSDGDDFKYNRIAIRAEERAGLVVWRPKCFCLVTGI